MTPMMRLMDRIEGKTVIRIIKILIYNMMIKLPPDYKMIMPIAMGMVQGWMWMMLIAAMTVTAMNVIESIPFQTAIEVISIMITVAMAYATLQRSLSIQIYCHSSKNFAIHYVNKINTHALAFHYLKPNHLHFLQLSP